MMYMGFVVIGVSFIYTVSHAWLYAQGWTRWTFRKNGRKTTRRWIRKDGVTAGSLLSAMKREWRD